MAEILSGERDGERVSLRGWLYNRRSSGGIQFLEVRDGTGVVQCTLGRGSVDEETYNRVEGLPLESTVEL
ncbi:MAG: asparagine--tRNA ligase, partial [Thermoplasmata archaeon]|nr:asparagine--tRNA ligase [Thermoplasmata archaeon]NIV78486.1 asparagine--tRNA ligase [Thermoplasmata archaeon]NIY03274.1 asparagine--tRNA ligase [Thermoplasmata archaeon]